MRGGGKGYQNDSRGKRERKGLTPEERKKKQVCWRKEEKPNLVIWGKNYGIEKERSPRLDCPRRKRVGHTEGEKEPCRILRHEKK